MKTVISQIKNCFDQFIGTLDLAEEGTRELQYNTTEISQTQTKRTEILKEFFKKTDNKQNI